MNDKEFARLVHAFVLGDGSLRRWEGVKNAGYSFSQIDTHKDYLDFQCEVLSTRTRVTVKHYEPKTDDAGVNRQGFYKLWTPSHPFYTTMYNRLYHDGKKTVSAHDLLLLDWQSLTIWYMDDCYVLNCEDPSQSGAVFLCTDNYTHAEVILLQKALYEKLNLPFNVRRRGHKKDGTIIYRLVLTRKNVEPFFAGIEPYIFPSFYYKLNSERKLS